MQRQKLSSPQQKEGKMSDPKIRAAKLIIENTGTQFIGGTEFCIVSPEKRKLLIDLLDEAIKESEKKCLA